MSAEFSSRIFFSQLRLGLFSFNNLTPRNGAKNDRGGRDFFELREISSYLLFETRTTLAVSFLFYLGYETRELFNS